MPAGIPRGERRVWRGPEGVWHHRLEFGGPALETRVVLDSAGRPLRIDIDGGHPNVGTWEERFEQHGDSATWTTPLDEGPIRAARAGHYMSAAYAVSFELPLLAAALVNQRDDVLPLLPQGVARLERLGERTIEKAGDSRTLTHYAVHGLDIAPQYFWLDDEGVYFADDENILAGWEAVFQELRAASLAALEAHAHRVLGGLIPAARERPLVIHGARLFDPESRSVRDGTTIIVEGERITGVGTDGTLDVPPGADSIDAAGRLAMSGLWDMHVHIQDGFVEELDAPLFMAAGVTTVRDLGGETVMLTSLRRRAELGHALAPRVLPALIMYGRGRSPIGVNVETVEEARAAVDRFADLGYVQVKIYNPVPNDLVPAIVERARAHGMRVSGHIPNGMTGSEAIRQGFDEIQHLFYVRIGAAGIRLSQDFQTAGEAMAAIEAGDEQFREFVELLLAHDVVVDPSLAVVEESVRPGAPVWLERVIHRYPARAARMAAHDVGPSAPPPFLREHWDRIVANGPALVRALHEAGVPLVAGTDAQVGGFELQRELELYVEAGIPAVEVLRLATLGAAEVMGMGDELGSIEPGKLADIILIDGDPTTEISDIRRVTTVIKGGRVYQPAAIYRALGIQPCCGG